MAANTHYFKRERPSACLAAYHSLVNRELSSLSQSDGPKMRGEYIKITAKDRAVIGEYAANGTAAAIRSF